MNHLLRMRPALRGLRTSQPKTSPPRRFYTGPAFSRPATTLINLSKLSLLAVTLIGSYGYLSDTRASIHSWLAVPLIKAITNNDPENAHHLAIQILKFLGRFHLIRDHPQPNDHLLSFQLWGKHFDNPIGLAAGFDKDGDAVDGLFDIGFGYVEIGSVTPEPQPGNPQPRIFRIPSSEAIINRYGFNSEGHHLVISKLRQRLLGYLNEHRHLGYSSILARYENMNPLQTAYADSGYTHLVLPEAPDESLPLDQRLGQLVHRLGVPRSLRPGRILAANLGKNKTSDPASIDDFEIGIQRCGPLVDALVINISSPNTPGLRSLQSKEHLSNLLNQIVESRDQLRQKPSITSPPPSTTTTSSPNVPAILIKIAPDLSVQELVDVGTLAKDSKIDGIIISNTTTSRPAGSGTEPEVSETGGLSGRPLKALSLRALSIVYATTGGAVPLIGCGGVSEAADVLEYGRAGASFVQVYSALTYRGLGLARALKDGVAAALATDGLRWADVVGAQAAALDLDRLLADDLRATRARAHAALVRDIQHRIRFVDRELARIAALHSSPPLPSPSPAHSGRLDLPTPPSAPAATQPPAHHADSQRGILHEWRTRKLQQIARNDFTRLV